MINKASTDQLDEAIDFFEENWSPNSRNEIRSLLEDYDLADDYAALTELIRIDIELCYKRGLAIRLEDYFDEFDVLLTLPRHVAQIAFEDFRSRAAHGHPVSQARWRELPGVGDEIWYQELKRQGGFPSSRSAQAFAAPIGSVHPQSIADAAFESALETIGFRLVQEIGQGAFSRVYLATQNDLADRHVVLKVVQKTLAEPQNMAMLQHTNIVPIYSFHRIQSRSVICMPYAGGVTLADFLSSEGKAASRGGHSLVSTVLNRVNDTVVASPHDEQPSGSTNSGSRPAAEETAVLKPLEQLRQLGCSELALWLFQRLAAGLAHSHARGVLHGDLKPANVLIRNDGEPALLDFNLSQSLDRAQVKHIGGTLPYMPPESYRALMGQVVAPHSSSDIYALGVMLFEFVTGRLPYKSPRSTASIDLEPAIELRRKPADWKAADAVSPGLRSIIDRCLEFEPADRYDSAQQLQEDLDRERQNLPLTFVNESFLTRSRKWIRRHPKLVSGSTVGMLLLALLIPLGVVAKVSSDRSRHMAVMANVEDFASESADHLSVMMADPLRHQAKGIQSAMKPLEKYGILDPSREHQFDSPAMTPAQRAQHRETALRHVLQVAFAEIDWLQARNEGVVDDQARQRLDQLVESAIRLQGDTASRATLYVRAERARLAGDPSTYASLLAQAESTTAQSDTEIYLEAIRLMINRRWQQARVKLTSLADRGSVPSALRWTSLGRSHYHQSEFEEAKLAFTQSIEHAPNASRLWLLRGLCYYRTRDYERAEEDFTKALTIEPSLFNAWADRGLSRQYLGDLSGAIDDYTVALEHAPGNVHVLLLRARALQLAGQSDVAEQDRAQAMQATDLSASSLMSRSRARMEDDPEGALADIEMAYKIDRGNPVVLKSMAHVLAKLGRLDEAIEALRKLKESDPDNERAIVDRAVLLARLGRVDEALIDLKDAMQPPNAPATLYQAGCVNALLPDPKRHHIALGFLSRAIQAGYGADDLADDPDLQSLHGDEGFESLVKTIKLGNRVRPKKKADTSVPNLHSAP